MILMTDAESFFSGYRFCLLARSVSASSSRSIKTALGFLHTVAEVLKIGSTFRHLGPVQGLHNTAYTRSDNDDAKTMRTMTEIEL